jgi:hypothetical protein
MVSAWPEPPSDIPAEWSAEATAAASSERKRPSRNPARKRRDPRQLDLEEALAASAGDAE